MVNFWRDVYKLIFVFLFQDNPIVAFFSNRTGSVDTFGTNDYLSFEIECSQIADSGVSRDITDLLGVT